MKKCRKCNKEKSLDFFHKHPNMPDGTLNFCKLCQNGKSYERYKKIHNTIDYKNKQKSWFLKKKYGITIEDYRILFQKQNGLCAICNTKETVKHSKSGEIRELAVDHDHNTGEIRALLCSNCNLMIDNSKDNILILEQGINYLLKYKKKIKVV